MAKFADKAKSKKGYAVNYQDLVVEHNIRTSRTKKPELVRSILEFGRVYSPLLVYVRDDGKFVIVGGRGRFEAISEILDPNFDLMEAYGIDRSEYKIDTELMAWLPAIAFPRPETDEDRISILAMEHIDNSSEALKPIEIAFLAQKMMKEYHLNKAQCAKKLGMTDANLGQILRLLELSDENQDAVRQGIISADRSTRVIQKFTEADKVIQIATEKAKSEDRKVSQKDIQHAIAAVNPAPKAVRKSAAVKKTSPRFPVDTAPVQADVQGSESGSFKLKQKVRNLLESVTIDDQDIECNLMMITVDREMLIQLAAKLEVELD